MSAPTILSFPADTAYVALSRTVAASMAALADLPIDQLEDVRLAVDEAVTQVIADAPQDSIVECRFALTGDGLHVEISGASRSRQVPSSTTFGWTVLSALVDSVTAGVDDGVLTLTLDITRAVPVHA